MSIGNRFKLFFGIIFVLGLLGGLVLYLNYNMSHVNSTSAKLLSDMYTVGTVYSGTISRQYASEGQSVKSGDKLFDITTTLQNTGKQTLKATGDGTVVSIDYLEGSFVPANKEIAKITKSNSLYIEAAYNIAPPDYAKLEDGGKITVTLPNTQEVQATIYDIQVVTEDKRTQTIIKARLQGVNDVAGFTSGTPVTTVLHLNERTLYSALVDYVDEVRKPSN